LTSSNHVDRIIRRKGIIELDQMLRKNREEAEACNDPTDMIRARVAAVAAQEEQQKKMILARTAKIKSYLEYGYNRQEISQMLGIHPYVVDTEASRIDKEERENVEFLLVGSVKVVVTYHICKAFQLHDDKRTNQISSTNEV
jgi:hypothetical protein